MAFEFGNLSDGVGIGGATSKMQGGSQILSFADKAAAETAAADLTDGTIIKSLSPSAVTDVVSGAARVWSDEEDLFVTYANKAAAEAAAAVTEEGLPAGTVVYSEEDDAVAIVLPSGELSTWSDEGSPNPQVSTALGAAWVEAPYELAFQHPGLAQGNTISASTSSGASWTYV